ncbi:MAG: DUF4124 domain-containing protein [Gammaproteobacteria bacterium]|nr:DUF4124 domain-containing protein [Gammaproteobacteria bacterium]
MKMSIFGMLFILLALTVGPLVYFNGGAAFMDDWFAQSKTASTSLKAKLNTDVVYAPVTTDQKVKVYKWKDQNGIWQFGNAPPPGQAGVESMTLQPNVNIMKALDLPEQQADEVNSRFGVVSLKNRDGKNKRDDKADEDSVGISKESLENPYAPESISELLQSSKNIQKLLDSRQQQQSQAVK